MVAFPTHGRNYLAHSLRPHTPCLSFYPLLLSLHPSPSLPPLTPPPPSPHPSPSHPSSPQHEDDIIEVRRVRLADSGSFVALDDEVSDVLEDKEAVSTNMLCMHYCCVRLCVYACYSLCLCVRAIVCACVRAHVYACFGLCASLCTCMRAAIVCACVCGWFPGGG